MATITTAALKPRDRERLMREPGGLPVPPTQSLTQIATTRRNP